MPAPPVSTLFPYTTLFRSRARLAAVVVARERARDRAPEEIGRGRDVAVPREFVGESADVLVHAVHGRGEQDRKSTRLNSSHLGISYAVFCLKKKKVIGQHIGGTPRRRRTGQGDQGPGGAVPFPHVRERFEAETSSEEHPLVADRLVRQQVIG